MKKIEKARMVGWYNPPQLARTGFEVFVSTIFGKHADRRLLEAAVNPLPSEFFYDFNQGFENDAEFWIDYISDVGDGFNSTYTMAYHLSRPELKFNERLQSDENGALATRSGRLLVFGGDEIYPTASHERYQQKLVAPYKAAFPAAISDASPTVFAVPGNHDWYDSLVSFSRLFCEKFSFAGWKTLQDRSYFAVKLVRGWWLFGTDMQLSSSLDKPQVKYFTEVMKHLAPEDSIILCNAEPHWIASKIYENDEGETARAMGFFEGHVLKNRTAVYLAGDLHHYRRHENAATGKQKITAGGGGAFLHPTHGAEVEEIGKRRKYQLRKSFPDTAVSRRLCLKNVFFPFLNPLFGVLTGLIYLLTAQAFQSNIGSLGLSRISETIHTVATDALVKPFALFWVLAILGGFILFTDTHSKFHRFVASPVHGLIHLAACFFVSWGVAYWVGGGHGIDGNSISQMLWAALLIFTGGWIIGSFIMGFYLLISLNVFGRHSNEAFSALGIADYKNFIRMKIDEAGNLTIYPIGVRRVARKWKEQNAGDGEAKIVPHDAKATAPELIENPITIQKLKPNSPRQPDVKIAGEEEFAPSAETERIQAV
jgi:hypothetical protein